MFEFREEYTKCPIQIQICNETGPISIGTGFFYYFSHQPDEWFLITNWHNVSGKNFLTKELLFKKLQKPTHLEIVLTKKSVIATNPPKQTVIYEPFLYRINLYNTENHPQWLEHPKLGSNCDVIAIPIRIQQKEQTWLMQQPINSIPYNQIPVRPGSTIFIIGFPRGITVKGLPIWKSGYIASEPSLDITIGKNMKIDYKEGRILDGYTLPAFFIDSQTREGMSGAPVIASYNAGLWSPSDPNNRNLNEIMKKKDFCLVGEGKQFFGCYSGRFVPNEEEAALGLCWREGVIEEICKQKVPEKFTNINF